MERSFGPLTLAVPEDGIGIVTFDRPPVNAVSLAVYDAIGQLADHVQSDDSIRAVILTAPQGARAWCGGADLTDFVGMDPAKRKERYTFINERLPRFYHLDRPVIAAINGHAIGIGMILAGTCDIRVASDSANFACPEIDYGLVAGGGGLFSWLKMPEGKVREILYTGRKFKADELKDTGFFNYIVPADQVLAKSLEIARQIARKSTPALKARKICSNALEGKTWLDAYELAQGYSSSMAGGADAQEGVKAFLEHRDPNYVHK